MLTSLTLLTLLYLALAIVEVGLIIRYAKAGPPDTEAEARKPLEGPERDAGRSDEARAGDEPAEQPLTFAY